MTNKTNPRQLSIRRLFNTAFTDLYKKLILGIELSSVEKVKLLSIAVILSNQDSTELTKLGYRIALIYGNSTGDFIPLYDVSVNTGLMPVADLTNKLFSNNQKQIINSHFVSEFTGSFIDSFKSGTLIQTEQQLILTQIFNQNLRNSIYVVAPTSYGKSELIISTIRQQLNQRICILIPSKSLLTQTKKRILDAHIEWVMKIVTHPDMHDKDKITENAVYILTQERLSRLLNIDPDLTFNILFVDEAHNLLENDSRSKLLASVISVLKYRNNNLAIKYLTPFIKDTSNLDLRPSSRVDTTYSVEEYVKTERFYITDYRSNRKITKFYDQFTNEFYEVSCNFNNAVEYITQNAAMKNIIYFNKPKDIERFVLELIDTLEPVNDQEISIAIEELSNSLDEDYLLIDCLKKGVVYHHGSMTEVVRHYVEHLFRSSPNLNYLVSSSTLLEGVNMPIEKLFLMSCSKGKGNLTASQFLNLVGRVNRFSEIFSDFRVTNLKKLEPEIHIVAQDGYMSQNTNLENFLTKRANVSKHINDNPQNVLLQNTEINDDNRDDYRSTISRLENLENGIIENYDQLYVTTDVGKLLIANNVSEINVFEQERKIQNVLDSFQPEKIKDSNTLIDQTYHAFIQFQNETNSDTPLSRLRNEKAQYFYSMMLDWKVSKIPFKIMIHRFIDYWDSLSIKNPQAQVYVGKWGDETNDSGGQREHYIRTSQKSHKQKINLAIVRIKEEEDFIEYTLFRFIDILNDLDLIDENFFKRIKYGTTNETTINLIKHGLSRSVAELVLTKYSDYVEMDIEQNMVFISPLLVDSMRNNGESVLQIFEVEMNSMMI